MSKLLADIITTCFEGGSNFWIMSAESVSSTEHCTIPWYADPAFYQDGWELIIVDDEGERHVLDQEAVDRAWELIPHAFPEDYDADDADVFLQLAIFKDVIYG